MKYIAQTIQNLIDEDSIFPNLQILRRESKILMCHGDVVEHSDISPGLHLLVLGEHFSGDSK